MILPSITTVNEKNKFPLLLFANMIYSPSAPSSADVTIMVELCSTPSVMRFVKYPEDGLFQFITGFG